MSENPPAISSSFEFDKILAAIEGLTWLPWVGGEFSKRPAEQKLLIVGESHYTKAQSQEQLAGIVQSHNNHSPHTRDVISQCLINKEWNNHTLDTLPRLFFSTTNIDRRRFGADTAFYNFIQRLMHYNQGPQPERPTWNDHLLGWRIFADVAKTLKPSHCMFIGVGAANSFNYSMKNLGLKHTEVEKTERISRTQGRRASLSIEGHTTEIAFVQHLGKYFSWRKWQDYLRSNHSELITWLDAQRYPITNNQ